MSGAAEQRPADATVTVRAPAKVNPVLSVGAVREDGFHPLDTVYQAVSLYDDVTVADAPEWTITVGSADVDVSDVPLDERNLALRAGRLLAEHHGLAQAAAVHVVKGIPVAGGMAGGSADAAATLVALDRLWGLETPDADLLALAARLGSDVPFALVGGTARGTGRGELVTPLAPGPSLWWVVVPDPAGLSTPEVYREFDREPGPDAGAPTGWDPEGMEYDDVLDVLRNDLQAPAVRLRPDLRRTFDAVRAAGADAVLLSGSGPTVLGLARDRVAADGVRHGLLEAGHDAVRVATGPVAGVHVVDYPQLSEPPR